MNVIMPNWPIQDRVIAFCTTRQGGVSQPPFASWNLGDHVGDDPLAVQQNRVILQSLTEREGFWLKQIHGTTVANLDSFAPPIEADAALTRSADKLCVVMTADCLPILFAHPEQAVVAAAHAGWRGLLNGVIETTVMEMACAPAGIYAWLGPAIGSTAFEVGDEVRAAFVDHDANSAAAFLSKANGKYLADIYTLAKQRLEKLGITQIFGGEFCTYNQPDLFFSYRRDGKTGRMASVIGLKR